MSDQNWRPINTDDDGCAVLITYRNEAGEEHVHVADSWGVDLDSSIFHTLCWRQCSGDWPGCKSNCPLFTGPVTEWLEEQKRYETMSPHDPFSFMPDESLVFFFLQLLILLQKIGTVPAIDLCEYMKALHIVKKELTDCLD